ncbi:MAG: DUF1801 domain-containing protein [Bacteroidetes bacterium]|nr:DUF1801 domain-containing protein [Bacteroidota bacterium]
MAKNKTTETIASVSDFVNAVKDPVKKSDSIQVIELMQSVSGFEAKMWGPSIVGFGSYHYVYESGREGDMPIIAFSPRTTGLVFYLSINPENRDKYLSELGKHKTDKGCITVKKLEDIKMPVLKKMIQDSLKHRKSLHSK